jgi:steroid delta-isomerase-like uncharacterized protein
MPQTPAEVVYAWFEEVWHQGREEAMARLMAADAPIHDLGPGGETVVGPESFKPFVRRFRQAFPDIRFEIAHTVTEADMIAVHCRVTGTHSGEGLGVPPTHRPTSISGMAMARVRDGQIQESWNIFDFLGLYAQLGLVVDPASA